MVTLLLITGIVLAIVAVLLLFGAAVGLILSNLWLIISIIIGYFVAKRIHRWWEENKLRK